MSSPRELQVAVFPGKVVGPDGSDQVVDLVAVVEGERVVALTGPASDPSSLADAKLFAASPRLLGELERLGELGTPFSAEAMAAISEARS